MVDSRENGATRDSSRSGLKPGERKLHRDCRLFARYLGLFCYGFGFARGAVWG
jgi:hypothetical protein